MKKLTILEFQDKVKQAFPNDDITVLSYNGSYKEATVICNKCHTKYTKIANCFKDKRKISICKKCYPTQSNKLKDTYELPVDYTYIEKYKGMHHKVLIKHRCGFIWQITPNNIKLGKRCPKCSKKVSKGEQRIINWLDAHNIDYVFQFPIEVDSHKLKIDFYLPQHDLYIEYNGEQHYKPIKHFGGETKFKAQIENDKRKQKYLKNKLLIISYLQFNQIEEILESSTTIS